MHRISHLTSIAILVTAAGLVAPAQAANHADGEPTSLPVTRAVLFASGVGYFEHLGTVRDEATVRLMFRAEQINDILKSMVVIDEGGGSVATVGYAANDPLERTLRSFGVDLSENPSLPELLDQLRGTEVILTAPNTVRGRMLNVETRQRAVGQPPTKVSEHVLNVVTSTGVRSVLLSSVDVIQLADPKLQEELNRALSALVDARDAEQRAVDVTLVGRGERQVRIGYLIETPVWKTSYRLDLSGHDPLLQGWAIVENTTNTDWDQVRMSLVSGRPISFVQDLYTPLYLPRPVVVPELFAALRPKIHDPGMRPSAGVGVSRAPVERLQATVSRERSAADDAAAEVYLSNAMTPPNVSADQVGELFRFTLSHPVDLPRRRSAMLPIVNEHVEAERVSVFNANVQGRHPLNGVVLTNTTDLKLLAGPVTVFDDGSYAGDAQVGHLAPGEQRLLTYAIDLDVIVDHSKQISQQITTMQIVQGVLRLTRVHRHEQEYMLRSAAGRDRTIVVEHPKTSGADLVQPREPDEQTPDLYRFNVALGAGETARFTVLEQRTTEERIAILDRSAAALEVYLTDGRIDPDVRVALEHAIKLRRELDALTSTLQSRQARLRDIRDGQERLRQNLLAVGAETELGKRYLARLGDEENRIELLETEIIQLQANVEQKRRELETFLANLNVNPRR